MDTLFHELQRDKYLTNLFLYPLIVTHQLISFGSECELIFQNQGILEEKKEKEKEKEKRG